MKASKGTAGSPGEPEPKQVKKDLSEVLLAYERLEAAPSHAELLRALLKLMVDKPSGAAFLAMSKVYVLQAIEAVVRTEQGPVDEAAVMKLLLSALRTASRGFLESDSCQCLRLASELLWVFRGRKEHLEEREAVRQQLVDKLKWWAGSVVDPHKCAHGDSESLPKHRWPCEWDPRGGSSWEEYVAGCNRVWSQYSSELNGLHNLQLLDRGFLEGLGLERREEKGVLGAQHFQKLHELEHASMHWRLTNAGFLRPADHARLTARLVGEMKPKGQGAAAAAPCERRERRAAAAAQQQQQQQCQPRVARRALAVYSYLLRRLEGCQGGMEAMTWAVQQLTALSLDDQALQAMPTNSDESDLQLWIDCQGILKAALEGGGQAALGQQWLRVPVQCVEQWPAPQAFEDTLLKGLAQQSLGVRLAREVERLEEVQLALAAGGRHSLESLEFAGKRVQLADVAEEELFGQLLPPVVLSVDRQAWGFDTGGASREPSEELGDYLGKLMDSLLVADSLVTPASAKRRGVIPLLYGTLAPNPSQTLTELGAHLALVGHLWFRVLDEPAAFKPRTRASGDAGYLSPHTCSPNISLDPAGLAIAVLGEGVVARLQAAWGQVHDLLGQGTRMTLAPCAVMLVAVEDTPRPASDDDVMQYKSQLGLRIQHMVLHLHNTGRLVGTAVVAIDDYIRHVLELHWQELLMLVEEEEQGRRQETLLALCRMPLAALMELEAFICILATLSFSDIWDCVPALQDKVKGLGIFDFLDPVEGGAPAIALSPAGAKAMLRGFLPKSRNGSQARAAGEDAGAQLRACCARFACLSQGIGSEQLLQLRNLEQSLKARKKGARPSGASQAHAGRRQGELPPLMDLPPGAEESLPGLLSVAAEVAADVDAMRETHEQLEVLGELVGGALGWSGRQQQELLQAVGLSVAAAHMVQEMLGAVVGANEDVQRCTAQVVLYADDFNKDPSNFLAAERELSLLAAERNEQLSPAKAEGESLPDSVDLVVMTRLGRMANCVAETIVGALNARAGALAVMSCLKRTSLLKMEKRLRLELEEVEAHLKDIQAFGGQWAALLMQQKRLRQHLECAAAGAEQEGAAMARELQFVGKDAAELHQEKLVPERLMVDALFGLDHDLSKIDEEGLEEVGARLKIELEQAVRALHNYHAHLEELAEQLALLLDGLHHHSCLAMGMLRAKCRVVPANYVGSYVLTQVLPQRWEQELAVTAEKERKALVDELMCEEEEEAAKKKQQKSKKKAKKKAGQVAAAQEPAAASTAAGEAEAAAAPSSPSCASAPSPAAAPAAAKASEPKPKTSQQRQGQQAASSSKSGSLLSGAKPSSRAAPPAAEAEAASARAITSADQQTGAGMEPATDGSSSDEEERAEDLLAWYATQQNSSAAGKAAAGKAAAAARPSAASGSSRAGASQSAQRAAGQQGSRPGSGEGSRAVGQAAPNQAPAPAPGEKRGSRIVGWDGSWECQCGVRRLVDDRLRCSTCGARGPCRQYLRGLCSPNCPYPHPPIELPPGPPPPGTKPEVAPSMAEQARQGARLAAQPPQRPPQEQREQQAQQQPQQQPPPEQQQPERLAERAPPGMRVVSWRGEWQCACGLRVEPGLESCSCGQAEPCSEWLRGTCNNPDCFLPHPPFSLREDPRPRSKYVRPLVAAWPGAPQFRAPLAAAVNAAAATAATAAAAPEQAPAASEQAPAPEQEQVPEQQQQQQDGSPGQDAVPRIKELLPPGSAAQAWKGASTSSGNGSGSSAKPGPLCPVLPGATAAAAQATPPGVSAPRQGTPDSAASGVSSNSGRSSGRLRPGALEFSPTQPPRALPAAAVPAAVPPPPWPATPPGTAPPQHAQHSQSQQVAMPRAPSGSNSSAARPGARSPYAPPGMLPIAGAAGTAGRAPAARAAAPAGAATARQGSQVLPVQPGLQQAAGNGVAAAAPGAFQAPNKELSKAAADCNCFLSGIIQCLWHCADFRRQVVSWVPQVYQSNAVVATLHSLFQQLKGQAAGGSQGGSGLSMGGANQLREALTSVLGQRFESGQLRDAGGVLLQLYACIRGACTLAAPSGALSADLDAVFGLTVHEYVWCEDCSKRSHDIRYVQYFYTLQAASLRAVRAARLKARMGALLGHIRSQESKGCDADTGGCGRSIRPTHVLDHIPRCFTLRLTWRHRQEQQGDIAATLEALDERVDLAAVYEGLLPGKHVYHLQSLLGFSGERCLACVLRPEGWALLDGAACSSIVGGWNEARQACLDRGIQPVLLFYEQGVAAVR